MNNLKKKLFPADLAWNILNNLDKFNDRNNLIEILSNRFTQLKEHTIFGLFTDLFNEAVSFYNKHGVFPDITYLNNRFPDGKLIKILKNEEFSMTLYDELLKTLEYELLIQKFNNNIASKTDVDVQACLELSKDLATFASHNTEMPKDTKESWLNSYDDYVKNFRGIETGMKELDQVIGVLGFRSLSTFAAPSGHGKSTFAISLAYNSALKGMTVDYVSFEVPKNHILFNLIGIESCNTTNPNEKLNTSKIKGSKLTPEERETYRKCTQRLMDKVKNAGGYINIVDQTEVQSESFEQFCASLESIAEERGKPADLIIIDNVDNLQIMKSTEKDEATRVNQYIIALDKYCKTYCNNIGTAIMLLTQVNRTGIKKINAMDSTGDKEVSIDVTCIQKFNALYEKSTTVLVGYSSPSIRANGAIRIMPVKLRNSALPTRPIELHAEFEYSRITGGHINTQTSDNDLLNGNLRDEYDECHEQQPLEDFGDLEF